MSRETHARFCEGGGVRFPSATRLVILCRGTAQKARDAAEQIIIGMKLRMNQEKTQVVDASRQPFDFLGYTFGPCFAARSTAV